MVTCKITIKTIKTFKVTAKGIILYIWMHAECIVLEAELTSILTAMCWGKL
jgi:hypothetical protein